MLERDMTPEQVAAREALSELLAREANQLGPALTEDPNLKMGTWVPNEFALVVSWTRLEDGEHYMTRVASKNCLPHHISGLLWDALDSSLWED